MILSKILFVGGDLRTLEAMKIFKEQGFSVGSYGLIKDNNDNLTDFDTFVLPVPATRDGITVNCPLTDEKITLKEIEDNVRGKKVLSGGYIFKNCDFINYSALDEYCIKNAVPTAEGAIAAAIDKTDFTLWQSKVLVIGAGRVAKVLYDRLRHFGCNLTVSARKQSDFALLDAVGIKHIETSLVKTKAAEFDIIFNTIDVNLFGSDTKFFDNTYLFDLSSKGCFDKDCSFENKKIYKLPALPSKCAPKTSGKILAQTLMQFIG